VTFSSLRQLALVFGVAFVFVACRAKRANEAEVDEGIRIWNEVWDGYVAALEANQTDADRLMAAGQKYIDDNTDKIGRFNSLASKRLPQSQLDRIKAAIDARSDEMKARTGAIVLALATSMREKDATEEQIVDTVGKLEAQGDRLVRQLFK
jgi:hypothetical protein